MPALTDEKIIDIRKACSGGRFGRPSTEPFGDTIAFARAIESAVSEPGLRTALVDLGWTPPKHPIEQPQCPVVAWTHPLRHDLVTTDPHAYLGLSTGSPRELVLKEDVVDHIDWLEHGIDEWRSEALAWREKAKKMKGG